MNFNLWYKKITIRPPFINAVLYAFAAVTLSIHVLDSALSSFAVPSWTGTELLVGLAGFGLYLVFALGGFGILVFAVLKRRWRACVHVLLAFSFVAVAFSPAASSGDLIHLAADYATYKKAIESEPNRDVFRFPWGDHAVWVTDGFKDETLVYDRSSSTAAQVEKTRPSASRGFVVYTRHLWGNFFVESESN